MSDQYAGQGGSYIIENGERRKVHNTVNHPDGNAPRPHSIVTGAAEIPTAPAQIEAGDLMNDQIGGE